ncbi:MAG: NADH:ubiquinone reductase (Na(+)-transporting) subunit F [Desulfobacteraceae bacterium]|nr:NADH:ubiquinone reductase (Na(+)-transporting) subunit F [Desulfobacteraceae bacterium]
MIYIVSLSVFTGVTLFLVIILLLVKNKLAPSGKNKITINDDQSKTLEVSGGSTLLNALVNKGILLPSACGGGGTCGMCKLKVLEGGGEILPTELSHVTRNEKNDHVRLACQLKIKEDLKIKIPDEIFNISTFDAEVVSNKNVATYIKELVLKVDPSQNFEFKAGAYIQIEVPPYNKINFSDFDISEDYIEEWKSEGLLDLSVESDEKVIRAYSLANPPYEKEVRLTVRIATPPMENPDAKPGLGSSYIFSLKPGDKVKFTGPYGDFFIKETENEICFVGGGAGMAPMRCHILHLLNTLDSKRKITFWYGARSLRELFYYDLFKELEEKHSNFKFYTALSEPIESENWNGMTGYIHQALYENYIKNHDTPEDIEYYLCGPPIMVESVIKMLMNEGVEEDSIMFDAF